MFTAKPKPIMIVTILLVVLAVLSTTSILTSRTGFTDPPVLQTAQISKLTAEMELMEVVISRPMAGPAASSDAAVSILPPSFEAWA